MISINATKLKSCRMDVLGFFEDDAHTLFLFTSTSGIDENVFWALGTTMYSLDTLRRKQHLIKLKY